MTDEQLKHMVQRFLSWRLPRDFRPDGGVTFDGSELPWGTNLLDYQQAMEMVRYMTAELPPEEPQP